MEIPAIHQLADPVCRVCAAPSGCSVRRSKFNLAVWVASAPDAPAYHFYTAAAPVKLDKDGMCAEGTGCHGLPKRVES